MKKLILSISLAFICLQFTNAQSTREKISYVSPKKDTLILPNDNIGELIASTWDDVKTKKPVIIFTDMNTIKRKNELLFANREEKKQPKK